MDFTIFETRDMGCTGQEFINSVGNCYAIRNNDGLISFIIDEGDVGISISFICIVNYSETLINVLNDLNSELSSGFFRYDFERKLVEYRIQFPPSEWSRDAHLILNEVDVQSGSALKMLKINLSKLGIEYKIYYDFRFHYTLSSVNSE